VYYNTLLDDKRGVIVSKRSVGIAAMPKECCNLMISFGENIKLARRRRKVKQSDIAKSVAISVQTYRKIENGDPSVGIGLYLSVLFMFDLHNDFSKLASPYTDNIGLAMTKDSIPKKIRDKKNKRLDF